MMHPTLLPSILLPLLCLAAPLQAQAAIETDSDYLQYRAASLNDRIDTAVKKHQLTPGATSTVPWFDSLVARREVGWFRAMPFPLIAAPLAWLIPPLGLFGGRRSAIAALILSAIWLVPTVLDLARGWWLGRHPHASPRWLRAVRAAVGDAVFDEALTHLTILHGDDPGYRIERAHLANAVQVAWNTRRKGRQQAEGVRLDDAARQT